MRFFFFLLLIISISSCEIGRFGEADFNYSYKCDTPRNFKALVNESNEVVLSWEPFGVGQSSFNVEYGLAGFKLGEGVRINTTDYNLSLSDTVVLDDYDYYVQANCPEGLTKVSGWVKLSVL